MPVRRVRDLPYGTFCVDTQQSEIDVKCPGCGGHGRVTNNQRASRFLCFQCGKTMTRDNMNIYRYAVHNVCQSCGRYYRVDVKKEQQYYPALYVPCPYCGCIMQGRLQKIGTGGLSMVEEIHLGYEPSFGLELWFLDYFGNQPVWAMNRQHLAYLIDYLDAELREKPERGRPCRTQSFGMPVFMKMAKNRRRIVKLLQRLQMK